MNINFGPELITMLAAWAVADGVLGGAVGGAACYVNMECTIYREMGHLYFSTALIFPDGSGWYTNGGTMENLVGWSLDHPS